MTKEVKLGLLAVGIVVGVGSLLTAGVVLVASGGKSSGDKSGVRGQGGDGGGGLTLKTGAVKASKEGQEWNLQEMVDYLKKSGLHVHMLQNKSAGDVYEVSFYTGYCNDVSFGTASEFYISQHKDNRTAKDYSGSNGQGGWSWGRFAFFGYKSPMEAIRKILDR